MKWLMPIRLAIAATLAGALGAPFAMARNPGWQPGAGGRGNHPQNHPGGRAATRPGANQEHLGQWMQRHQELPIGEQLRELQNEPGFSGLPAQTQQRYRDRLIQLNSMNPQQRQRMLARNEALERLSLPERQEYRAAVQRFAGAPPDRRRLMARAVLDLRAMPPEQRRSVINSDRFRAEFSDPERSTLTSLLSVEPYTGPEAAR
jgi:hypothetical protein